MQVDIKELIAATGRGLSLYPGKKLVVKYQQPGEYKSHCVTMDWRTDTLRVDLKAGLSGRDIEAKELAKYPVSFQAPTYFELMPVNDIEDEDGEDEQEGKGKGGSGRRKPKQKKIEEGESPLSAFDKVTDGKVPEKADIAKFVVMGKELAQDAFAAAYESFQEQLHQTKLMALDIMKSATDMVKKATPGGGLQAKGNETVSYQYDADRNAPLFGGMAPG